MSIITVKPYEAMSLAELKTELAYWDRKIGTGGGVLQIVLDARDICAAWVARRESEQREQAGMIVLLALGLIWVALVAIMFASKREGTWAP